MGEGQGHRSKVKVTISKKLIFKDIIWCVLTCDLVVIGHGVKVKGHWVKVKCHMGQG